MISRLTSNIFKNSFKFQTQFLYKLPKFSFASKDLSFSDDCRNHMLRGCDKLADAVQVTLGNNYII